CSHERGLFVLRRSSRGELEMLEEILDALIGSEPFERLLASRERPLVARAPAGADFVLAATARALESPILAVASGPQDAEHLARGATIAPDQLAERFVALGYERSDVVEHRGEFAVRGGIVDVFPGTARRPVRIEFWGDDVESMREFTASTQLSTEAVERIEAH